jgi:hypothetical protein
MSFWLRSHVGFDKSLENEGAPAAETEFLSTTMNTKKYRCTNIMLLYRLLYFTLYSNTRSVLIRNYRCTNIAHI